MWRVFLLILVQLCATNQTVVAQPESSYRERLDSIISTYASGERGKYVVLYGMDGNVSQIVEYKYDQGWVPYTKNEYGYDDDGNNNILESYIYKDEKWEKWYRMSAEYDDKGRCLLLYLNFASGGEWTPFNKEVSEYGGDGDRCIKTSRYYYKKGEWLLVGEEETNYTSDNHPVLVLWWNLDDDEGMKRKKTKYVYDSWGKMIREERYLEKDDNWEKDVMWEYVYDSEGRIKEEQRSVATYKGEWTKTGRNVMYRDVVGNVVRREQLGGISPKLLGTNVFSYDVNVKSAQVMGMRGELLYRHSWDCPVNELHDYSCKILHKKSFDEKGTLEEDFEYYYSTVSHTTLHPL